MWWFAPMVGRGVVFWVCAIFIFLNQAQAVNWVPVRANEFWNVHLENRETRTWWLARSNAGPGQRRDIHFQIDDQFNIVRPHDLACGSQEHRALSVAQLVILVKTSEPGIQHGFLGWRRSLANQMIAEALARGVSTQRLAEAMASACFYSSGQVGCDQMLQTMMGDWGVNAWQRIVIAGLEARVNSYLVKLEHDGPFERHGMASSAERFPTDSRWHEALGFYEAYIRNTLPWSWVAFGPGESAWPQEYARQRVMLVEFAGILNRVALFLARPRSGAPPVLAQYRTRESSEHEIWIRWFSEAHFQGLLQSQGLPIPSLENLGWNPSIDFVESSWYTPIVSATVQFASLQSVILQFLYARFIGAQMPQGTGAVASFVLGELADGHAIMLFNAFYGPISSAFARLRGAICMDHLYLNIPFNLD